jgi:hypothetical protein
MRLGRFIELRYAYGSTYTNARLTKRARTLPPQLRDPGAAVFSLRRPRKERLFAHPERALLPTPLIRGVGAAYRPIRRGIRAGGGTVLGG